MKKDKYKTIVVFLKDTTDTEYNGIITAYFPCEKYSQEIGVYNSYSHIGQHSACNYDFAKNKCKIANEQEYKDLFNELQSIGYNLEVVTKLAPINKMVWNGVNSEIDYHRQPTASEIKFGYGATHYLTVPKEKFLNKDGTIKSHIKHTDGLIYTY